MMFSMVVHRLHKYNIYILKNIRNKYFIFFSDLTGIIKIKKLNIKLKECYYKMINKKLWSCE